MEKESWVGEKWGEYRQTLHGTQKVVGGAARVRGGESMDRSSRAVDDGETRRARFQCALRWAPSSPPLPSA